MAQRDSDLKVSTQILHIDAEFALRDTGCFDSKFLQIVAARKLASHVDFLRGRNAWRTPKNVCVGGYSEVKYVFFNREKLFFFLFFLFQ